MVYNIHSVLADLYLCATYQGIQVQGNLNSRDDVTTCLMEFHQN